MNPAMSYMKNISLEEKVCNYHKLFQPMVLGEKRRSFDYINEHKNIVSSMPLRYKMKGEAVQHAK